MRKRSVACLCLLLAAVMLLSACDGIGGNPANTPVPRMTVEPLPVEQDPEDLDGGDYDDYDDYDEHNDYDDYDDYDASAGVALGGPGLPVAPEPTPTQHQAPRVTLDPSETPIPVDPLDKPTQVPLNLSYVRYESSPMGISFDRPAGWREDNPADSNVQFMEPEGAARNGYRAMLTVRVAHRGSRQERSQARALLEEVMEEMGGNGLWSDFRYTSPPSTASLGGAGGYHTYYWATFNGLPVRGRIIVVARGNALYMVRLTSTAEFYELYETIYRKVRDTWRFH
ncbi:MAG: hypothetical protein FWD25_04945 [Clostridia bacterium]|nr:hypothetical protein [Clostridia bacterium]